MLVSCLDQISCFSVVSEPPRILPSLINVIAISCARVSRACAWGSARSVRCNRIHMISFFWRTQAKLNNQAAPVDGSGWERLEENAVRSTQILLPVNSSAQKVLFIGGGCIETHSPAKNSPRIGANASPGVMQRERAVSIFKGRLSVSGGSSPEPSPTSHRTYVY